MSVFGNASKSPCGSFLNRGIELLEAVNEGIKSTRVNNSLSEVRRVLCD